MAENALKMQFVGLISRVYMFFGTGNPNFGSILKPEVELMVFLRMRNDKITKNGENCPQIAVLRPDFRVCICFSVRGVQI